MEIRSHLGEGRDLLNLYDLGITDPIPETGDTLEANACIKAQYLYDLYGRPCFADDSGLEVAALDGAPGVRSARYAGEAKNDQANMDLLLKKLENKSNRSACFKTVIAYLDENASLHLFTGVVNGLILKEKRGTNGFGYDPIFQPEGFQLSFAEMNLEQKNIISHRAKAIRQLVGFLTHGT